MKSASAVSTVRARGYSFCNLWLEITYSPAQPFIRVICPFFSCFSLMFIFVFYDCFDTITLFYFVQPLSPCFYCIFYNIIRHFSPFCVFSTFVVFFTTFIVFFGSSAFGVLFPIFIVYGIIITSGADKA